MENEPGSKLYYSIGEVAEMFGLTVSQVRYWENEFSTLQPKKNKKGDRLFTAKDIEQVKLIHYLLKEKGYTIEGAKQKLRVNPHAETDTLALIGSLQKVRDFLVALKENIDKKSEPEQQKDEQEKTARPSDSPTEPETPAYRQTGLFGEGES